MHPAELHVDPHLKERNFIQEIEHPVHGAVPLLGFAPNLSASDVPMQRAPLLGEHTDEVLGAELELDAGTLARLRDDGVVG